MTDAEPLIEADNLVRRFPNCEALGGVTFQVRRGEIAAILGPNGSGKTTTLRILATFLAPTAGWARVAGYDTTTHSLEARRCLGYLPENVPLYPEIITRVQSFDAIRLICPSRFWMASLFPTSSRFPNRWKCSTMARSAAVHWLSSSPLAICRMALE